MNFFESQERARRKTGLLVVLFALAVLSLIALTELLVMMVFGFNTDSANPEYTTDITQIASKFSWASITEIALGITAVVVLAALYKLAQLSKGGKAVAEMLGGILIDQSTTDPDERKILNVVEEMAIASGTPVPPVYLLEEEAINAFAAGHTPRNAVIGITRGCIRLLNRDELQGVVAHEFSHIFNGDMRLNMRLIGVLYGILVIGLIGETIVRNIGSSGTRSSSKDNNGGGIVLLGIGLIVIGYAGTFFGNLIKAAVSRQREFLADASAVQFTRNPGGIGGALKKIGGYALGSRITTPEAGEVSHMFFGEGVRAGFLGLQATHPPLEQRIRAIEPRWKGEYPAVSLSDTVKENLDAIKITEQGPVFDRQAAVIAAIAAAAATSAQAPAATVLGSIGAPTAEHLERARTLLTSIPDTLRMLAREPYGCRAVVLLLLMDTEGRDTILRKQMQLLQARAEPDLYRLVQETQDQMRQLDVSCRLPLLDISMPALQQLSKEQYNNFMALVMGFIRADYRIEPFEWALYRIICHHAGSAHTSKEKNGVKFQNLEQVQEECRLLLSALAQAGTQDPAIIQQQFNSGWQQLGLDAVALQTDVMEKIENLDNAVRKLCTLAPLKKPQLLKACCACVQHDGIVTAEEVELVRAVADSLDTPMPPLLAGQALH